mgnify:FL=1
MLLHRTACGVMTTTRPVTLIASWCLLLEVIVLLAEAAPAAAETGGDGAGEGRTSTARCGQWSPAFSVWPQSSGQPPPAIYGAPSHVPSSWLSGALRSRWLGSEVEFVAVASLGGDVSFLAVHADANAALSTSTASRHDEEADPLAAAITISRVWSRPFGNSLSFRGSPVAAVVAGPRGERKAVLVLTSLSSHAMGLDAETGDPIWLLDDATDRQWFLNGSMSSLTAIVNELKESSGRKPRWTFTPSVVKTSENDGLVEAIAFGSREGTVSVVDPANGVLLARVSDLGAGVWGRVGSASIATRGDGISRLQLWMAVTALPAVVTAELVFDRPTLNGARLPIRVTESWTKFPQSTHWKQRSGSWIFPGPVRLTAGGAPASDASAKPSHCVQIVPSQDGWIRGFHCGGESHGPDHSGAAAAASTTIPAFALNIGGGRIVSELACLAIAGRDALGENVAAPPSVVHAPTCHSQALPSSFLVGGVTESGQAFAVTATPLSSSSQQPLGAEPITKTPFDGANRRGTAMWSATLTWLAPSTTPNGDVLGLAAGAAVDRERRVAWLPSRPPRLLVMYSRGAAMYHVADLGGQESGVGMSRRVIREPFPLFSSELLTGSLTAFRVGRDVVALSPSAMRVGSVVATRCHLPGSLRAVTSMPTQRQPSSVPSPSVRMAMRPHHLPLAKPPNEEAARGPLVGRTAEADAVASQYETHRSWLVLAAVTCMFALRVLWQRWRACIAPLPVLRL